jgi:hypothetical protein
LVVANPANFGIKAVPVLRTACPGAYSFLIKTVGMGRASFTAMTFTTSFRNLEVWQESMMLVEEIYALSRSFPRDELFGLTAQLRGAAISIPSNIGEGAHRKKLRVTLPDGPWSWCLVTLGFL